MKKQILFAHSGGAQGGSGEGSFDLVHWLREELGDKYEIKFPVIEDPEAPDYSMWRTIFDEEFPSVRNGSILIGHSLGGSMLLKYLSENQVDCRIEGIFLVAAPYWGQENWEVDEFRLKEGFTRDLLPVARIHLFHCKNDPIVPFEHMKLYKTVLPQAEIHALNCDDHSFANGLPELLEYLDK